MRTATPETRRALRRAINGGTLYGDGKWGDTLAEVERLGYCDSDGRVTPAGWDFYYERPRSDAGRSDYTRPAEDTAAGVGGVE